MALKTPSVQNLRQHPRDNFNKIIMPSWLGRCREKGPDLVGTLRMGRYVEFEAGDLSVSGHFARPNWMLAQLHDLVLLQWFWELLRHWAALPANHQKCPRLLVQWARMKPRMASAAGSGATGVSASCVCQTA